MPWIHHPATQDGPVSVWRWIKFHVGVWLSRFGATLEYDALHPGKRDEDDIPF